MHKPDIFRVGVIGAGNISEFHMRALSRVSNARVVGIVDIDRDRAQALCRKWNVDRAFADVAELFECGVDVVHVLTPPGSHAALALAALARGCHVYVEKPLAASQQECDEVVSAARDSGRSV